jgi:hypothetical protein
MDRLFAHLESVEPGDDFVARVMARARQGEVARWRPWQRTAFGIGYCAALAVLAVLAFLTGVQLERAGLRDLLSLGVHDLSTIMDAPGVYLSALRDTVPWLNVVAVIADLLVLVVATRLVLRVSAVGGTSPSAAG